VARPPGHAQVHDAARARGARARPAGPGTAELAARRL
jgi:hypothetical protein